MSRRILSLLLALVSVFALAACSGLPTSSSVNPGLPADEVLGTPDFLFVPNSPQPGMTPQQIVQGFIDAGTSPVDNWAIARLFLAPEIRSLWNPEAGVTIDSPGERIYTEVSEEAITVTVTPSADVDETGAYAVSDAVATALPFRLALQPDGEWRIIEANDGIVMDRDFFLTVFDAYDIMFFDPAWEFLVPDVRWFPARENSATRIATALVDGAPSPWLSASLFNAFPEDVALASQSVTVDADRSATVELSDSALALDATTLGRMQAQLEDSLAGAGVQSVQMAVDGNPVEATAAATRSTTVSSSPLVLTEAGFGFLAGDGITEIPGLSDTITENLGAAPVAIQVGAQRDVAALQVAGGVVARAQADGTVLDVDIRPGLIAPTIDPYGYIWSVPRDSPTGLVVSGVEGPQSSVGGAWADASQIHALSVSRDGTRLAALVTVGGQHWAAVAGVIRDGAGLPTGLGDVNRLARLPGPGIAVAWLDDATIGVAASDLESIVILDQLVGGEGSATDGPAGITALAGANQPTAVRLRDGAGQLYVKRGSNWALAGAGILVLATQQGAPR